MHAVVAPTHAHTQMTYPQRQQNTGNVFLGRLNSDAPGNNTHIFQSGTFLRHGVSYPL